MAKHGRLSVGEDRNSVYFLGYALALTPIEYAIVCEIEKAQGICTDELLGRLGMGGVQRGNIAVHICSINKKATMIGGRKLILYARSKYYFNEEA